MEATRLPRPERLLESKRQRFDTVADRLPSALRTLVERRRAKLDTVSAGLVSPKQVVREKAGKLETLSTRLASGLSQAASKKRIAFARTASRLRPEPLISDTRRARKNLTDTARRARPALDRILTAKRQKFSAQDKLLETLSYQATLQRGYAIVRDPAGKVLRSVAQVSATGSVDLTLADGHIGLITDGQAKPAQPAPKPKPASKSTKTDGSDQGSLF